MSQSSSVKTLARRKVLLHRFIVVDQCSDCAVMTHPFLTTVDCMKKTSAHKMHEGSIILNIVVPLQSIGPSDRLNNT